MLIVLFVVSFIIYGLLFSFNGVNLPYLNYNNGNIIQENMLAHVFSTYGFQCINLIMMVTLVFTISTVLRNSALAIGIGVFLLTVGGVIVNYLIRNNITWAKYILFANTDLAQYF